MNIGSKNGYPSSSLSNFAPHPFTFDGVLCNSMEGFLQSLKFSNIDMQAYVCTLVGLKAKYKGKKKNWWKFQKLYWQGVEYDRHSDAYQSLLDRAYNSIYSQSESFRNALKATGNAVLTHTIGNTDPSRTVLTQSEFCRRLMRMRNQT